MATRTGGHSQQMAPTNMGHFSVAFNQLQDVTYLSFERSLTNSERKNTSYSLGIVHWLYSIYPHVNIGKA